MDITKAKQAADLAAAIDGCGALIVAINGAQTRGALFGRGVGLIETDNSPSSLIFPEMTAAESAQLYTTALAIVQARLDAANAALAAL